tara:strand:+ start:985 stop:1365 length:381 start_codon:yes stop_codon:yes gene_type:complete
MFLKGIFRQVISVLFLSIYCFSLTPISFFEQNTDCTTSCCEHHSQVLYCENLFQDLDISCTHESHVLTLEERCTAEDYVAISDKVVLNNACKQDVKLYNKDVIYKIGFIHLDDNITYLNKSPPYLS